MLTINDKDLHAEIREALDQEPKVMPGEIGIAVEFGVATPTRGNAYGKHSRAHRIDAHYGDRLTWVSGP